MRLKIITAILLLSVCLFSCKSVKKIPRQHRKPVIYVYSNTNNPISISLEYYGELTVTYPKIEEQWNIISDINGKIKNLKNGREYAYLYYEGIPTNNKFDLDKGFVISKDSVPKFLERKLDEIGFNYQESNDLIAYWLPELTKDKFVAIKFLFNEECDKYSRLTISPNPESEFRLMIEFINLNSKIDLKRQRMIKLDRKPYTVVEWGGINYTN